MNYFFPDYYHSFQCIGKDCPDTCCGGWNISIDSKSLMHYRRLILSRFKTKGSTHAFLCRLRKAVDFRHRSIRLSNRYCPLLTEDKLCGIYLHLGRDSMCKTCRIYPRHQEEFGKVREITLSLSCPEAARIILSKQARPKMLLKKTVRKCPKDQLVDESLLEWLSRVRDIVLDILWESPYSLETSVFLALAFCQDLQNRHNRRCFYENDRFNLEEASKNLQQLAEEYLSAKEPSHLSQQLEKMLSCQSKEAAKDITPAWLLSLLELYSGLEPVVADWPKLMDLCRRHIASYPVSMPALHDLSENGVADKACSGQNSHVLHHRILEKQLLTYFIHVYFLGSIYDDNLFDKMEFAAASWIITGILANALQKENDSSNPENSDDFFWVQAAYLYSREVENSDFNLNKLFQGYVSFNYNK